MTGGYETPSDLVKYRHPGLLLRFPITYGATSKGQYEGRGKHHDRLESAVTGEIRATADATGSVILPWNDTLTDVIRVHIRKIEHIRHLPISSDFAYNLHGNDSLFSTVEPEMITTDTYQWYEKGYRYPIFESIETYRGKTTLTRDAYFYHPAEQAYLPEDAVNQVIRERKQAARKAKMIEEESNLLSFACYPNPVKDHIEIELTFRKAIAVNAGIWDMQGRLVKQFPSETPNTHYRETLDVQSLPQGYYVVKVSVGRETASEKIIKN